MKIKLHELNDTREFTFSEKERWLKHVFTRLHLEHSGPIYFFIRLTKQKEDLFVEGHLRTRVVLPCSRCAKDFEFSIDEMFTPVFVHGKEPKLQPGGLEKGEMDVTYFQGDEIDLSDVLNEQVLLYLPQQPLCHEECRGLCLHCGQDLNQGACQCKKEHTQSVFDVLKDLKIPNKGG